MKRLPQAIFAFFVGVLQIPASELPPAEDYKPEPPLVSIEHDETIAPSDFGQDPTDPKLRVDLRMLYDRLSSDEDNYGITLRFDLPVGLGRDKRFGELANRLDVPALEYSNAVSPDNPDGNYQAGMGDLFLQSFWVLPHRWTDSWRIADMFALGGSLTLPTATKDNLGDDLYIVSPGVAILWNLKHPGDFVVPVVFYSFDAGSKRGTPSPGIEQIHFRPVVNIVLQRYTKFVDFVTFWDNEPFIFQLSNGPMFNAGDYFIPMHFELGKKVGKRNVISIETAFPLARKNIDLYDWKIEFKIAHFF